MEILKIQEIKGFSQVTPLPNAPAYVKGVLKLRGTIVPIVDLRKKFRLPDVATTPFTVIVVVQVQGKTLGFVVDAVSDVLTVPSGAIQPTPDLLGQIDTACLTGLASAGEQGEKLVILLDTRPTLEEIMELKEKIILVVGGAAGIGRATALLCAERGAQVVVADLDEQAGWQVAAEAGGVFLQVDVCDEASVQAMARAIDQRYGRLDVLIHTAGVLLGGFTPLEDFQADTFRKVIEVNVTGSFLCVKHCTPLIRKSESGVVILTSSGAATAGSSSLAYGSSKGGVNGFAVTLTNRLEVEGLRVNVLSPGNIDTPMKRSVIAADAQNQGTDFEQSLAAPKLGSPEGVAKILTFLASDDADYEDSTYQ